MQIQLLGTAAAEGIPAFYCDCRVCNHARKHGGREVRTRSGAIVDGALKVDLPPDTLMQMHRENLDARDWSALLFTHGDDDHFAPRELQYCLFPFNEMEFLGFAIYGNDKVADRLHRLYPEWPLEIVHISSFHSFQHADFTITPISAHHNFKEDSQNHIIERSGKTLLYATDTGIWFDETWEFLKDFRLDLLVIECTEGVSSTDYPGHLSMAEMLGVVERLMSQGTLDSNSKLVTTHHSHNGEATYCDLVEALRPHNIEAGYDGMRIEI